jgi:hypothetical protein
MLSGEARPTNAMRLLSLPCASEALNLRSVSKKCRLWKAQTRMYHVVSICQCAACVPYRGSHEFNSMAASTVPPRS